MTEIPPATPSATSPADEQAIRDLVQHWATASSTGDLDSLLAMMTTDVVFFTVGNAPMSRDDFARGFGSIATPGMELVVSVETHEVVVDGDVATMSNQITVRMGRRGEPPSKSISGRTLTVLRRGRDGAWRIWRDANLMAG